jgi:hypothetical protein
MMKKKILALVMTYNPENKEVYQIWRGVVTNLISQRNDDLDVDVAVCDNCSGDRSRSFLKELQKETKISLVFVDKRYPVNLLWNFGITCFEKEKYDYIIFNTSDCMFTEPDALLRLVKDIEMNNEWIIISPQVDNDMNMHWGHHVKYHGVIAPTRVDIGEGVNGHFHMFNRTYLEAFDYKRPDLFWGHRSEPLFPYLCASINKQEVISHKVQMHHATIGKTRQDFPIYDKLMEEYGSYNKFLGMLRGEGRQLGLWFEELYGNDPKTVHHNDQAFDDRHYAKSDELYRFIKKELFLQPEQFDYKAIESTVLK